MRMKKKKYSVSFTLSLHEIKPGNMFQLIDKKATFNYNQLEGFVETFPAKTGTSYFVISIIGPQSGGKSTLLNALFGTNFRTMNGFEDRTATTKGVWMARSEDIGPYTIVMDIEGTDGAQNEGDTTFEKRSAIFALLISDVVMININCNSIGLAHGGSIPLLRIIFKVILDLYDAHIPRKTTLMFVIRDRASPHDVLERRLQRVIQEIWISVEKPPAHRDTPFDAFFNVQVVSLIQYRELSNGEQHMDVETDELFFIKKQNNRFSREVDGLKQRLLQLLAPGEVVGDRPEEDLIPIRNFPSNTRETWHITNMEFSNMASHLEEIMREDRRRREREKEDSRQQLLAREKEAREKRAREKEAREKEDLRQQLLAATMSLEKANKRNGKKLKIIIGLGLGVAVAVAAGLGIAIATGTIHFVPICGGMGHLYPFAVKGLPALPALGGSAAAGTLPNIQIAHMTLPALALLLLSAQLTMGMITTGSSATPTKTKLTLFEFS